jgi:hypothetical protein
VEKLLLRNRELDKRVPFIYFFGTPQSGAELANLAKIFSSDPLIRDLSAGADNEYLQGIENDWRAAHLTIRSYCGYETRNLHGIKVVDRLSASRNCAEPPVAIDADHIEMVKPSGIKHDSYIALANAVRDNPIRTPQKEHGNQAASTPPEVVLTTDLDITYFLSWIPGTRTFPTVEPAGKSGYPAMELKNLSGNPVVGVSIDWSVSGAPIEQVVRSSEHFKKYPPIAEQGMYDMDNGNGVGIPVDDHVHSDISYAADESVPVDIPGGIWDNFYLRMIATKDRPPDNAPPIHTIQKGEPVAKAVLTYHQANKTYTRIFQIKALVFVIPNSALLAYFGANGALVGQIGQVDRAQWSPDNFRAQMRFVISGGG